MKKTIQLILLCFVAVVFTAQVKAQESKNGLETVCFQSNMDCHDCESKLHNYLKFEKGVKDLKVDLKSNTIKVVYKSGKNTPENVAKGIKKQGYEANPITGEQYEKLIEEAAKK